MKRRLFLFLFTAPLCLFADKPDQAPQSYHTDSANKRFVAFVDAKTDRIVISERRSGTLIKLWQLPGWHPNVFLANNGRSLVLGSDHGGMLAANYDKNEPVMSFYYEATLIRKVTLADVIKDFTKLQPTASHLYWGRFVGFDSHDRYWIETVEGRIAFDVNGLRV